MSKTRIGILGGGQIVQNVHLPTLQSHPGFEVVAVAEHDEAIRCQIAERYPRVALCVDCSEVVQRDDVDAVLVALPNALHAAAAVNAFQKGKHVYLEKPLALDLFEGQQVLSAWRASGRIGMMGFNYRCNALYAQLREQVQNGTAGDIVSIRTAFCTPLRKLPPWKRTRKSGGGVLFDLGSHHIDLVRWIAGCEVVEVRARLESLHTEQDNAWLELRLANGIIVQSFFSLTAVDEDHIEIFGTTGKLSCRRYCDFRVEWTPAEGASRLQRLSQSARQTLDPTQGARHVVQKLRSAGNEPSYHATFDRFAEAINNNLRVTPDLDDGYASLRVLLAAEQSAERGFSIELQNTNASVST
jgi:predicted dehydrogenase